eukprot:TRINITY_DN56700_c0_g1_i1.p1 TRINITY_DN56700_c0_g1~~TRINITY_DN56700_c0_g1_i1.p1  ORF type:complete len:631 (+),score=127.01 TRINITY_DN56700_c0_g1_i1:40-1932(+)
MEVPFSVAPIPEPKMQHQLVLEQQQQQAVMAVAMAAAASMSGTGVAAGEPTVSPTPAQLPSLTAFYPPGVDPTLAQAYAQTFTQCLQQAYANGADPVALAHAAAAVSASASAAAGSNMNMNMVGGAMHPQHPAAAYTPPWVPPPSSTLPAVPPLPVQTSAILNQASAPSFGFSPAPLSPTLPGPHVISMTVEGMATQYQWADDDLQQVFSRYGTVSRIQVDASGTIVHITYQNFAHAHAAVQELNGKVLDGLDGKLKIVHVPQAAPPVPSMPPYLGFGYSASGVPSPWAPTTFPPVHHVATHPAASFPPCVEKEKTAWGETDAWQQAVAPDASGGVVASSPDGKSPPHVKGVRKFTCRFLIGIENDKDFNVVRRIIGQNGAHMKRIFGQTEAKLRLRGKGSGYFEGANQRESSEPLQLCISCTMPDGYRAAVTLAEELLEDVYAEYRVFCKERGKPEKEQIRASSLTAAARGHDVSCTDNACSPTRSTTAADSSESPVRSVDIDIDDDDDDEASVGVGGVPALSGGGDSPGKKEASRRRARRSRGGRARGGDGRTRGAKGSNPGDPPAKAPPVEEIKQFIDQRNEARRQNNFTEADRIRQLLHERGVALMDEPGARGKGTEVTTWRYWHA